MRGWTIFSLVVAIAFSWSCENPETLTVSKAFSGNNLSTFFADTFSVATSTVQLDSLLTNNTGSILLGKYRDDQLGQVSSSSYFQISYSGTFKPDPSTAVFDSMALIMHYNHQFSGDTTMPVKFNIYQLSEPLLVRQHAVSPEQRLSVFSNSNGFYNTSSFKHFPNPIGSATINYIPHNDSVFIRLPDAIGVNWVRLAKIDSAHLFSQPQSFVSSYFYGLYIEVDPATQACVAGFTANKTKVRVYYHQLAGDSYPETYKDFSLYSPLYQFNHIEYDRTGTQLSSIKTNQQISSLSTNDVTYIQGGTGLVTRLDFPSLKSFFSTKQGVILNAVYLQVPPVQGSYPKNFRPPSPLQLYLTDVTNIPIAPLSGEIAAIQYDYEYGINTFYNFSLFSYVLAQVRANTNYFPPLLLAPSGEGGNVQRVYIGDRFHPLNKIKLLIYYSYVLQ